MREKRKRSNSAKINLTVSIIFHTAAILGLVYLAAREGILGKDLKTLTAELVKDKKPEAPKVKPPEPKVVEQPKVDETPKQLAVALPPRVEPPPPTASDAPAVVAPPPMVMPDFDFNDGAKAVVAGDANTVYKNSIERALTATWKRPDGIADDAYVAEVELNVDSAGKATGYRMLKGSGNTAWDNSVKTVMDKTKSFSTPPPKNFPGRFTVRFDVESQRTEDVLQLSSR
jgi:TonB family protein